MGTLTNISLFAGGGGFDKGSRLVGGIKTICYVENDTYCQAVLMSRFRDGSLDNAPIWDDIKTFDGKPWRGRVDIVSGGFPCQPHSSAGNRAGQKDERNLWPDYLRIVRECKPRFVLAENVFGIFDTGYALEVLASLEEIGYCSTPYSSSACSIGASHPRKRVFFLAHSKSAGRRKIPRRIRTREELLELARCDYKSIWIKKVSSEILRVPDGLEFGMDRHRLCGNGVVPQQSAAAWEEIKRLAGVS